MQKELVAKHFWSLGRVPGVLRQERRMKVVRSINIKLGSGLTRGVADYNDTFDAGHRLYPAPRCQAQISSFR